MESVKESKIFRVYKCNGKPSLVLRVSFPKLDGEGEGISRFNSFYSRIQAELIKEAEEIANSTEKTGNYSGLYRALEVSYVAESVGNSLKITRKYEIKQGKQTLSSSSVTDVFTSDLFFAKNHKNIKKQRFIPSRNVKNITKASRFNPKQR